MPDSGRCAGLNRRGDPCGAMAMRGSAYCRHHQAAAQVSEYTDEVASTVVSLLRAGNHLPVAAAAAGVTPESVRVWAQQRPDFRERVEHAQANAVARSVTQVAAASQNDWRAATWMLERQLVPAEESDPNARQRARELGERARLEARATLEAIGEDPELSTGAIERYVDAVITCSLLDEEWERLGNPGTTLGGSTGFGRVPHPLVAQLSAARREAAALGQALGLDPRGRARLARRVGAGRPPGAASAPDRAQPPRRRLRAV